MTRDPTPLESRVADTSSTPRHWGFWGTCLWSLVVGFVFVLLQSVTILLGAVAASGNPAGLSPPELEAAFASTAGNGTWLSVATLLTAVVCSALVAGVVKLRKGAVLADYLGLRPVPGRSLLFWLGITVLFLVVSDMVTIALGRPVIPEYMSEVYRTAQPAWLLWIALVVGAPLFEETFFRGFMMKGLASSFLRPAGAVVVTSVLWAALHLQYDAYGVLTIFCMGLLFGSARLRTGSLAVPLALHGLANLGATIQAAVLG